MIRVVPSLSEAYNMPSLMPLRHSNTLVMTFIKYSRAGKERSPTAPPTPIISASRELALILKELR